MNGIKKTKCERKEKRRKNYWGMRTKKKRKKEQEGNRGSKSRGRNEELL
jgi:hypothetical protein